MSFFQTSTTSIAGHVQLVGCLGTLAIAGLYAFYRWVLLPNPYPGIPYNHESANKIFGDLFELKADKDGLAAWSSKFLGKLRYPICQVLMGPDFMQKPIVLVADVGDVREAMFSRSDFDRSSYLIDRFPLFGDFHLNMKTTDEWRLSRNWSKDLLTPQYMNEVASPAIELATKRLIKLWEGKSQMAKGRPFDMTGDVKGLSIDVIVSYYFGNDTPDSILVRELEQLEHIHDLELPVHQYDEIVFPKAKLHEFCDGIVQLSHILCELYTTILPPPVAAFWTRYFSPRSRKYISEKEKSIRQLIARAVQRVQTSDQSNIKSGLDHMVWRESKAAKKAGRKPVHSNQIMVDETYGALIAGQHTTSAAIVWILKYLSDYPEVQTTLREEIHRVLSVARRENRLPTPAEIRASLQQLPYLLAVIEEMLRLRQAMLIPRDATRDTTLLGCIIPQGTTVLFVCQGPDPSILRSVDGGKVLSPRKYPGKVTKDASEFDPERWLLRKDDGSVTFDGNAYPQLAFGGGIRACWGRKLADVEMQIVTTLLVWRFDFLDVPKELSSHRANYDITYRALQGYVNIRTR